MTDGVEIKTNAVLEVVVDGSRYEIQFEAFRAKPNQAGIGVYLDRSLTGYPSIPEKTVDAIRHLIAAYAKQKNSALRFE